MLYGLLAGRPPFVGISVSEVFRQILTTTAVTVNAFRGDVPAGLIEVVERCLKKSPDERFESASDVTAALRLMP